MAEKIQRVKHNSPCTGPTGRHQPGTRESILDGGAHVKITFCKQCGHDLV